MHFKKLISIWALLALMLGQVALAQHSAAHIDHGVSFEVASSEVHDEHDHGNDSQKHECPECVLTKSLQTAFYNDATLLFSVPQTEIFTAVNQSITFVSKHREANAPRAPPTILI